MEDKAAEMVNEVPPNGERAAVKKVAKKAARVVAGVDLPRSQYLRAKTLKQKLNAVSSLHVAMMCQAWPSPPPAADVDAQELVARSLRGKVG